MVAKTSERGQPTIWQSFATTDMGFRDRKYNFSWRGNTIWVAEEIRFGFGVEIRICLLRQENVGKTGLTLFPVFVPPSHMTSFSWYKSVFPLSTLHFGICLISLYDKRQFQRPKKKKMRTQHTLLCCYSEKIMIVAIGKPDKKEWIGGIAIEFC